MIEFKYKDTALIEEKEIMETAKRLENYVEYLNDVAMKNGYDKEEGLINLPFDSDIYDKVKKLVSEKNTNNLKYIIVAGIGGSNLGTAAVYEALFGKLDFLKKRHPKIIFADTVDASLVRDIIDILDKDIKSQDEILVNIISKSGTTTETIINFEVIYDFLNKKFGNAKDRVVVTTDYGSKLWEEAEEKNFSLLDVPKNVGGRYSVFSAVGLFPLMLAGADARELLNGAQNAQEQCLKMDVFQNPALASAILIYLHNKNGISINNNFFFNPELESLGKWHRQLVGESIGKERDIKGNIVNAGITPIISIGSMDLHSMAQLYLGGPRDKFTNFIYAFGGHSDIHVPKSLVFDTVEGIKEKELREIMSAILKGVKTAYKNNKLPFAEINMPDISEYYLGEFLQFKMIEIMYLAKLLNVNAFDQPKVEDYKKETKRLLLTTNY